MIMTLEGPWDNTLIGGNISLLFQTIKTLHSRVGNPEKSCNVCNTSTHTFIWIVLFYWSAWSRCHLLKKIIFILAILIIISESGRGLSSFWSCPCSHLRTKQHLASPHWSELLVVKSLTRTMKKMTAGPQPCPCRSALHMRRFQALRKLRRERRWTMQSRKRERTSLKTGKTGREKTSKSSGWDCGLGSSLLDTLPPPSHLWRWTTPGPPSPHQKQQNSGEKILCPLPSFYFGFPCLLQ